MQGTRVQALVRKIPRASEQLSPCAPTTEPTSHNYWAHVPQLPQPVHLEPLLRNKRSHRNEKSVHRTEE